MANKDFPADMSVVVPVLTDLALVSDLDSAPIVNESKKCTWAAIAALIAIEDLRPIVLAGLTAVVPELADLMLIADDGDSGNAKTVTLTQLKALMAPDAFEWTTSEQVWPFETDEGATLYAKKIDFGAGPNNTTKTVAHGITGLLRLFDIASIGKSGTPTHRRLPFAHIGVVHTYVDLTSALVRVTSNTDSSGDDYDIYIIYTKS